MIRKNYSMGSKPEKQAMILSVHTGKAMSKRDPQRAIDALRHAQYIM